MSIRDVLVHLSDDGHFGDRLDTAVAVAEKFDAHLIGLYVPVEPYLPGYIKPYFTSEMLREHRERKEKAEKDAKSSFDERISQAGVRAEWRQANGKGSSAVASQGRYADIVIVGQHDPDAPSDEAGNNLAEEVAMNSCRPVIAVPFAGEFKTLGRRVLVAWNGSREAARATHDALPFLTSADKVLLLGVNAPDAEHIPGADISTHLARHGIGVEIHNRELDDVGVGDAILNAASDYAADLLVIGAYGHSRMRELVLGGVTRHLLRHMTVPVLMSH
jgi:nucleotide-binding universal stress UspA family protein